MIDQPKPPGWKVSTRQRTRAQSLRQDSTDAEHIIWDAVRAHRLLGASFRRQTPIGPFIVDFVCHAAYIIVEIDGGQHSSLNTSSAMRGATPFWRPRVI